MGGISPDAATAIRPGTLLRLSVACFLPIPLVDVRITRAVLLDASDSELASTALNLAAEDAVNTAQGNCNAVDGSGGEAGPLRRVLPCLDGSENCDSIATSPPLRVLNAPLKLEIDMQVLGTCSAPALGSLSALTSRASLLFPSTLGGSSSSNASDPASFRNRSGVNLSPAVFIEPFIVAAANSSGVSLTDVRVIGGSFATENAGSSGVTAGGMAPVAWLHIGIILGASILCLLCTLAVVCLMLWRRKRKHRAALAGSDTHAGRVPHGSLRRRSGVPGALTSFKHHNTPSQFSSVGYMQNPMRSFRTAKVADAPKPKVVVASQEADLLAMTPRRPVAASPRSNHASLRFASNRVLKTFDTVHDKKGAGASPR